MSAKTDPLLKAALAARGNAYAPYSKFSVGCALEDSTGKIYQGCNVENASYGGTICAERSAIVQMVSAGGRNIIRLWVVGDANQATAPCGICRQVISEFGPTCEVIFSDLSGAKVVRKAMGELLPLAFGPADLAVKGSP